MLVCACAVLVVIVIIVHAVTCAFEDTPTSMKTRVISLLNTSSTYLACKRVTDLLASRSSFHLTEITGDIFCALS